MSLLEQNTIKKKQIKENNTRKLNASDNDNRHYKIKAIQDSMVYIRELKSGYLSRLYY